MTIVSLLLFPINKALKKKGGKGELKTRNTTSVLIVWFFWWLDFITIFINNHEKFK